jgi:hypothetical protein
MSRRIVAAAGALLFAASACTGDAFDASSNGTGGGGQGGGAAPDAMPDPNSGGSSQGQAGGMQDHPDASDDGTVLPNPVADATPPDIGAHDARADAISTSWCAGQKVIFCADFDRVNAPTDGWTTASVTAGAALDFDLVAFTSPTRSLHSKIPAGMGLNTANANLHKVVSTTLAHSVLEFDCNVKTIGTAAGDWLLTIGWLSRNANDEAVGIYAMPGKWTALVGAGQIVLASDLPAPPQYGKFVRITLDVVWSTTAGSLRIAFDGVTVFNKTGLTTSLGSPTKTIEAQLGFQDAAGSVPASEMSIDNVTLQML